MTGGCENVLEMSGSAMASLLRIFAETKEDALVELKGRKVESRVMENTDAHTGESKATEKIIVTSWSRVEMMNVVDFVGGTDTFEAGTVGFVRLRSQWTGLEPSFLDRQLINYLQRQNTSYCFIIMSKESNECLGVRYSMSGYLMDRKEKVPVMVTVPCLGVKTQYQQGSGTNQFRDALVQGLFDETSLEDVAESFNIVIENFKENYQAVAKELEALEEENAKLVESVRSLEERRRLKIENSYESKKYRSLTGSDIKSSLTFIMKDVASDLNMNNISPDESLQK